MWVVEDIHSRHFNYTEQNSYFKILIRYVLGIDGRGGIKGSATTNGHLKISVRCVTGKYEAFFGGRGEYPLPDYSES